MAVDGSPEVPDGCCCPCEKCTRHAMSLRDGQAKIKVRLACRGPRPTRLRYLAVMPGRARASHLCCSSVRPSAAANHDWMRDPAFLARLQAVRRHIWKNFRTVYGKTPATCMLDMIGSLGGLPSASTAATSCQQKAQSTRTQAHAATTAVGLHQLLQGRKERLRWRTRQRAFRG